MRTVLLATVLLFAGCELLPMPQPPTVALPPDVVCEPPPNVGGIVLECRDAIAAVLRSVGPGEQPVTRAAFRYGPCQCPDGSACDCAIQTVGTVLLTSRGAEVPVRYGVQLADGTMDVRVVP